MRISRKSFLAVAAAATLALAGCSNGDSGSSTSDADSAPEGDVTTLTVGASPAPHARILKFIDDELAADNGIKLEIKEYTDYVIPNEALKSGDLDANFYQTVPYLEEQSEALDLDFTPGSGIHLEPLALYSEKFDDVNDLPDGATIGIISDTQNQARALGLLATAGLVELPESGDVNIFTVEKIKDIEFTEVEPAQLVRSLQDVDAAVINGNYAQEGGLTPADDGLVVEATEDNPNVNVLVWRSEDNDSEAIKTLEELLHSPEVKQFIEQTWPDGSVIPAF
ncbi:MAG: MetQ/NlpA family ABC transporter substrate-binding protein [Actinomycetaceae bacterium]|nr:MetQ/NlpA family ABC transporter substrate-binding protein [Actinomycetaceae bacterium]